MTSSTRYMHLHHAAVSHRQWMQEGEGEEIQALSDRVDSLCNSSVDINLTDPQPGQ